jgi:aminopeptidase N
MDRRRQNRSEGDPRIRNSVLSVFILIASCAAPSASPAQPRESAEARLQRDVRFLASDAMKGRDNGTPEGAAASEYVANQMAQAGLEPGGQDGSWFQTIPGQRGDRGRNVIGALKGTTGRWIVIGAHHDGLGERRGAVHNGADDNASGVAVILEAARRLRLEPPSHGILICSFDAEEDGLVGSTHFVKSGLYPVSSFVAMICLDLVGGTFLPGDENRLFALGSESSGDLFDWIGRERDRKGPLEVERTGIYAIEPLGSVLARSDYSPFRLKKVPFVFFSTGTPWYYHTEYDDVERLDFAKMDRVADLVTRLALAIENPQWRAPAPDYEEDARLMAAACRRILEHPAILASDRQRAAVAEALEALGQDGTGGKQAVQRAMIVLFNLAATQRPAH